MFEAVRLYLRLRAAYRRHGVLPYSRRTTWTEARFAKRMRSDPVSGRLVETEDPR